MQAQTLLVEPLAVRHMATLTQKTIFRWSPKQMYRQLVKRLRIHIAFEMNDRIEGYPVRAPTPGIELWLWAGS